MHLRKRSSTNKIDKLEDIFNRGKDQHHCSSDLLTFSAIASSNNAMPAPRQRSNIYAEVFA
jgi:hypothetical protein